MVAQPAEADPFVETTIEHWMGPPVGIAQLGTERLYCAIPVFLSGDAEKFCITTVTVEPLRTSLISAGTESNALLQ